MCPIVDCAFPGFCAISKPSYFQINGMNCTGCPVCSNQILGKRSVIPIDLGHLIQCPLVDCAFKAGCTAITHSTFQWNGRQCQGCPICEEKLSPREVLPGNLVLRRVCCDRLDNIPFGIF
ncbi:uncharacterized protein LOC135478196 [Liolophura sinensis]|uniref:uncharacterized protein LOC135478196 n=1 Tax=Liolophura sinensis TaxID=3198878 RepID=UPI0031594882